MIINNKKIADRQNGQLMDPHNEMYIGQQYAQARTISFYDEAPQETIGIYEFQNIAVSRL